jgi:hypothetical protein
MILEMYVWGLLLQLEGRIEEGWKLMEKLEWSNPGLKRLSEYFGKYLDGHEKFKVEELVAVLPEELVGLLKEVYLSEKAVEVSSGDDVLRELGKVVEEIKGLGFKKKLKDLSEKIEQLEKIESPSESETVELEVAQREFSELLKRSR